MTNAERQRLLKARRAAEGLVQCNVWVPASAVPEFVRAAELIRAEPYLAVARLVDTRTGRLRGLKVSVDWAHHSPRTQRGASSTPVGTSGESPPQSTRVRPSHPPIR